MANDLTDLMQTKILPLALPVLRENAVMAALVNRDLQGEAASRNATIRVPLPQDMGTAGDLVPATGTSSTDLADEKVDVVLDKWKYKQFQLTDKEMFDTVVQGVLPSAAEAAVKSIANAIDGLIDLFKDIYTYSGAAGSTPDSIADLLAGRRKLNENLAPLTNRRHLIDVEAEEALLNIENIRKVNEAASTEALREGMLGRIVGVDHFMDQNLDDFTQTDITDLDVNGAVSAGAKTMNVDGGTLTDGVASIGDLFTVAGVEGQFVLTGAITLSSGAATGVTFEPAAPTGGFADNAVVTFVRDATATTYKNNLMFHRDAFCFVQRPLADGETGQSESSSIAQQTDPVSGISLRLETWRSPTNKTRYWCFDVLYGVKTLRKELACRVLG